MVTVPILVFPDWSKGFHVHVNASSIYLGALLSQPGEGYIGHLLSFSSRKLSTVEINYTNTKREWLAMVYALQKFFHYLLGGHFKMFTDHSALKYLVNNLVLGGRICRWILLFQEYLLKQSLFFFLYPKTQFSLVMEPPLVLKRSQSLSRVSGFGVWLFTKYDF
jgi:hypothetical protein